MGLKINIKKYLEHLILVVLPLVIFSIVVIKNRSKILHQNKSPHTIKQEAKLINLALKQLNQREYKKSIETNIYILEINPNNATAYNNIGTAYAYLKQWDKGIINFKKALKINPKFQLAKNNLNWMYLEKKKQ